MTSSEHNCVGVCVVDGGGDGGGCWGPCVRMRVCLLCTNCVIINGFFEIEFQSLKIVTNDRMKLK